ncbi:MAG TPA: ABC transporter ATP-binding protein [Gammaproteobacteria bacterium]|nr:ABC transporter ATP-binding protein [Gammaproteobacteria bacterium]
MTGLSVALRQDTPIPLDASFACAPGEVLALVGPSGSGKSTILRIIAGLYRPREGRVSVDGEHWLDTGKGIAVPPHRRAAGIVFQSYALFPHMTAVGNISAALENLPTHDRRRRAEELLRLVNLGGLEDRRPAELSGGQQQRVAVARALAREPGVLLLDEPFSAVDRQTRERLYRELAIIRRRLSMPVVLVTHDLTEALMLADSLCLLHRGRTLQHGRPLDVMQRPATVEVARLVGQRNIFTATVVEQDSDTGFTIVDWNGHRIEAASAPQFRPGDTVAWLVPHSKVLLHRRDRPSRGTKENPVSGVISEHVVLGDTTVSVLNVEGRDDLAITFHVPAHVADRNRLAAGERASVSLLAQAIHLMPAPDETESSERP